MTSPGLTPHDPPFTQKLCRRVGDIAALIRLHAFQAETTKAGSSIPASVCTFAQRTVRRLGNVSTERLA